jgi:formylglycine-generating enzyme required for sulfatase activity
VEPPAPDLVETQSDEHFHARTITRELMIRSGSSVELVELSSVRHLDVLYSEEEQIVRAQFTLRDGSRLRGNLLTRRIQLQEPFGSMLSVPMNALDRISFKVDTLGRAEKAAPSGRFQAGNRRFRDHLRDGSPGPEMMRLEGGMSVRGDLQGDGDFDESPPTEIEIGEFAIGVYEVTFDEYDRFCASTGCSLPDDQGWGRGRRPVVNVTWDMAKAFTAWLSDQTGNRYRLPTDAEWEYAARGGTQSRFWWGDETGVARSNCAECGSLWDGEKTSHVGRFNPNPFGLHDTAGNVFEWVADCWSNDFSQAPQDGSALEKPDCGVRVIRGGAWSFPQREVRSANRWRNFQSRRSDDTGFRVVRELTPE